MQAISATSWRLIMNPHKNNIYASSSRDCSYQRDHTVGGSSIKLMKRKQNLRTTPTPRSARRAPSGTARDNPPRIGHPSPRHGGVRGGTGGLELRKQENKCKLFGFRVPYGGVPLPCAAQKKTARHNPNSSGFGGRWLLTGC